MSLKTTVRATRIARYVCLAGTCAVAACAVTAGVASAATDPAPLPVTGQNISGPSHNGYQTGATNVVTINSADPGGPGVATVYYQIDPMTTLSPSSPTWTTYTGPFPLDLADGYYTLWSYATDRNGASGTPSYLIFGLDTTPPVTTLAVSPTPAGGQAQAPVTFTLSATDNLSGVANSYYTIDGGATQTYTSPFQITGPSGQYTIQYWSVDNAGNVETAHTYTLQVNSPTAPVGVSGNVPSTLELSVSNVAPNLGFLTPGLAQTYSTTVGATVLSTADTATLTAADTSTTFPGHLVNSAASGGPYELVQPLQVEATSTNPAASSTGWISLGTSNPATLLNYNAPVSNDNVTLGFEQVVGATDPLRTGTYTKTITFTLSTTTP